MVSAKNACLFSHAMYQMVTQGCKQCAERSRVVKLDRNMATTGRWRSHLHFKQFPHATGEHTHEPQNYAADHHRFGSCVP